MGGREINIFDRKMSFQQSDRNHRFQLKVPVVSDKHPDPAMKSDYDKVIREIPKIKSKISELPNYIHRYRRFFQKRLDKKLKFYSALFNELLEKLDQHYHRHDFNYLEREKIEKWILEICADLEDKGFPAREIEQKYELIQDEKVNESTSDDLIDLELLDLDIESKEEKEAMKRNSMIAEKNPLSTRMTPEFDQIYSELAFLFRRNLPSRKNPEYQHFLKERLQHAANAKDFHEMIAIKCSALDFYHDERLNFTEDELSNFTGILNLQLKELNNQYYGLIEQSIFAGHLDAGKEIDQDLFKEMLSKNEEILNFKLKEARTELHSLQSIRSTKNLLDKIDFHAEDNNNLVDIFN